MAGHQDMIEAIARKLDARFESGPAHHASMFAEAVLIVIEERQRLIEESGPLDYGNGNGESE